MKLYLVVPLALVVLLIAASGVAAVTRGWVLPMNRRRVRTPRIYGWGQLVVAFGLCWQLVFGMVIGDADARPLGTLVGGVVLVAGFLVMMVGQLAGRRGKRGGSPGSARQKGTAR